MGVSELCVVCEQAKPSSCAVMKEAVGLVMEVLDDGFL